MASRRSLTQLKSQLEAERGVAVRDRSHAAEAAAVALGRTRLAQQQLTLIENWLGSQPRTPAEKRSLFGRRRPQVADPAARATEVLSATPQPDGDVPEFQLAHVAESRQLVIEFRLPSLDSIPTATSYRYSKTTDDIVATKLPEARRRALYTSLIAQVALQCVARCFDAIAEEKVKNIDFSGYALAIDPTSGRQMRPFLISLRVDRETFSEINLDQVDAVACLRSLHAAVSPSPSEMRPIRPVSQLSMIDARFVTENDVLSGLDERPNLLELTPTEFEELITNLFTQMGLDAKLTRASRDGGVDCVAFDLRPVIGGKIVIQAKRYSGTVGVSAVRDLYGTVLNEGANKGILVTTSGYGPAAFDFAKNKPLELLSGANLLALLAEWAGVDARIVPVDVSANA